MNWYLKVIKQYADFNGRARRTEYWIFVLMNFIITLILTSLDNLMGSIGIGVLSLLYSFFIIVPSLAVTVRRLHDIGKSGWMILVVLIPFIGAIWLLILMATVGTSKENDYGPSPK